MNTALKLQSKSYNRILSMRFKSWYHESQLVQPYQQYDKGKNDYWMNLHE